MTPKELLVDKIRDFEKRLQSHMKSIYCPTHLSLGHERVAADLADSLLPQDWLFSTHRNHHHYLAKGGNEQLLWDEIMGLPTGLNKGFAGSQGITDRTINFHASAILGGLVGVAAGTAYAVKNNKDRPISVCCIGDAGTEQGVFWETLNFAALYSIPLVFVCENNGKSVDALLQERQSGPIKKRVFGFDISVFDTVQEACNFSRDQRKPSFTEQLVELECAHLNMATMLDLCDHK